VLGPLSVAVMLPLVLVWFPVVLPVTVTLNEQVPLAVKEAPVSEIVRVEAVVVTVPPHAEAVPSATDNPAGSTSVNEMPLKAIPVLGLVILKASVLVLPWTMLVGEKDLESVGGLGRGQPVMVISSRCTLAVDLAAPRPAVVIRNQVVLMPLVAAVPVTAGCHEPLVAFVMEKTSGKLLPSLLE